LNTHTFTFYFCSWRKQTILTLFALFFFFHILLLSIKSRVKWHWRNLLIVNFLSLLLLLFWSLLLSHDLIHSVLTKWLRWLLINDHCVVIRCLDIIYWNFFLLLNIFLNYFNFFIYIIFIKINVIGFWFCTFAKINWRLDYRSAFRI
jgi:hypothetical protein